MPRKWVEFAGGTWTKIDLVSDSASLTENAARDRMRALAMSGDIALKCTPAALGNSAAAITAAITAATDDKFLRTVTVTLETAAGEVHTWFSGTRAITIADTAAGAAAIAAGAETVTFVNGVGSVVVEYTGTWAATNTSTLTVVGSTLLGHTVANKTSIDTLIA